MHLLLYIQHTNSSDRAVSALPGFKPSVQPALADEKVRYVGELVAMCVADTRAEAEDIAARVEIDFFVNLSIVGF